MQLADGDPHAVCTEIAQAQDTPAGTDANEADVLHRPMRECLHDLAALFNGQINTVRLSINVSELQACRTDCGIVDDGYETRKVSLHLESLWDRNITITTRLVDTVSTPMLLNTVRSRKIDPKLLITHRFKLDRIRDAYETFAHAADTRALKVIIEA